MAIKQLSDGNSEGNSLGQNAADLIGFHGSVAAQASGNAQAALTRGGAAGFVAMFATTNSPASVATLTTAELGITLTGGTGATVTIATTDLVLTNKPTAQAGLGNGPPRVSSAGVIGIPFVNLSAGFLTPTATQIYATVALRGLNSVTTTLTPAAVAASTTAEQTFSVTGLRANELVAVSKATNQGGLVIANARVSANNTLAISFGNTTVGTLTPTAAEVYTVISLGGFDATDRILQWQVSAAPVAVATLTTAVGTLTMGNLAVSDTILGVSKPTNQAGLIAASGLVSAAGVGGVVFGNFTTASITPTANEVYNVQVMRPNPAAPLIVYSTTLTPTSVAANTTAEQTFAVTGIVASSFAHAYYNGQMTAGLGILGTRVSSSGNIGINFANFTSAAIVPPSGNYLVGNFQCVVPDTGCSVIQTATQVQTANSLLVNAMRLAFVNKGLIAGA